ncbi:DNA modification methylase [Patescibacteria group bacterium]|nr:DNA modification methylase [Patescibacteria group bacterium]
MIKLKWTTEKRKVNDLVPFEKNPRTISPKQLKDLTKSLKKFDLVEIPAIDMDEKILAGHQRLKVLQLLGRGEEIIDCRIPNRKLTKKESEQYLISSNALGGDWDFEKLKSFDLELLTDIGFDQIELANLWDDNLEVQDEDFNVDEEIKKIKKPKTKLGDLIQLGPHRLYCADSTNPENLKRLFGKERASMIYSDPVYNLRGGVDYNSGIGGKQNYGGNVNDNRSDEEYKEFLKKSLESALSVAKRDTHVFYYCDQTYIWLLQTLYKELGITNKRVCLWIKNGQNPTPGVAFSKCYEPCVYGVKGKSYISPNIQNLNEVMNKEITTGNNLLEETLDELDVWLVKRLSSKNYEHATSKPSKLHEKAIRRCTKPGDIILDSFSGSASTMIAAEQLKRKVYAVELEPIFCDLAIKRYEKLTGIKAKIYGQEK